MKKCLTILLSFLLTGAIVLFCVSFSAQQAIAPAMGEEGAPVDDGTIREQEEIIRARVAELGELYGFSTEPVMEMIDEGILRDLNEQASGWWSALLKDGKPGDEPEWDTEDLEYVLYAELYTDEAGAEATQELTLGVLEEVRRSVLRTVLPMRHKIVELGMQKVGKRVDVPNLVAFFMGVPWAVLALCALLAGLIALIQSRRIRGSLRYIGSAMGAAAIVIVCAAVLYLLAGVQPMIREASESLTVQYGHVLTGTLVRLGILSAAMAAACVLFQRISRKDGQAA